MLEPLMSEHDLDVAKLQVALVTLQGSVPLAQLGQECVVLVDGDAAPVENKTWFNDRVTGILKWG